MFSSKFPLGQLGRGPRLPINSQQPLVGDCLLGLWGCEFLRGQALVAAEALSLREASTSTHHSFIHSLQA